VQLPPSLTQLKSTKPVVAIVASRTGVGKSQTTRWVANYFKNHHHLKVAVIRHPMPYDQDLNFQRCERFETMADMDKYRCTIEEREEYYRHIDDGNLLFAGVDYEMILRQAEQDADLILWDGGNNDCSFYQPTVTITLVDSLRPTDELHYFPGETNVRLANAILITKTNELASLDQAEQHAQQLREKKLLKSNNIPIVFGRSKIVPQTKNADGVVLDVDTAAQMVQGKRVLVVDDGPTLTHGGLASGAGYALAKQLHALEIVDPRPFAQGSLVDVFTKFPHLSNVLPAMGYGAQQIQDLKATIDHAAESCDTIVIGTPMDMSQVFTLDKPVVVARYDLEIVPQHQKIFYQVLDSVRLPMETEQDEKKKCD
jgi:predicted GTPase